MTGDERKLMIESIQETSDKLTEVARRFDRLRWMAEKDASEAFVNLADTAGKMTLSSLDNTATLLELLFTAGVNTGEKE